jgi:hypothetical protein
MPAWQLTRDEYRLKHAGLAGVLRLRGPAPGIRNVTLSADKKRVRWPGPVLAVRAVQAAGTSPVAVRVPATVEHRLRSDAVDLQLVESIRLPVRLQLYWCALRPRAIDSEILLTPSHDFDGLEVLTISESPAERSDHGECLVRSNRWIDVRQTQLASWLVVPRDGDAAASSLDGRSPRLDCMALLPPCRSPMVCFRPPGRTWSYVEMSHSDDCVRVFARRQDNRFQWGFGLFGLDVEKGILLRGRVRGVFVPRRGDLRHADRRFKSFVAEPPRLSV